MKTWTQAQALDLVREIEAIAPRFGCHVALTGGCLYKDGARKDADFLFYRIRQVAKIDKEGLFAALTQELGIVVKPGGFGWVHKAAWAGRPIDLFFPEEDREAEPAPAEKRRGAYA